MTYDAFEISSETYFINPDGSYQYSYIYSPYEEEEDEYKPFYEYRTIGVCPQLYYFSILIRMQFYIQLYT